MRGAFYLRIELLDSVYLPLSTKPTEASLIKYLSNLCHYTWINTYKDLEFRPVSTRHQTGLSRACGALHLKLQDWLNMDKSSGGDVLQLSHNMKRALWIRMAVELWNLQKAEFIRDAIVLAERPATTSNGTLLQDGLSQRIFEHSSIEFRYFSILLWLYSFRNKIAHNQASKSVLANTSKNEYSPRARPRSISDGFLDAVTFGSPRKEAVATNTPVPDLDSVVRQLFNDSFYTVLCIIGFHFDAAADEVNNGVKSDEVALVAQHLRYIALLIQLKQSHDSVQTGTKRVPASSTKFEATLFREITSVMGDELPNIAISKLAEHLKSSLYLAAIDVSLCSAMNRSRVKLQVMRRYRSAACEHMLISAKRKETILVPVHAPSSTLVDLSVMDCHSCTIITANHYRAVRIASCTKCTIVLPAVSSSVSVIHCSNTDVHAAAVSVVAINCYDTQLHCASVTPPIVAGDSREVSLGPYDVVMQDQRKLMALSYFDLSPDIVGAFHEVIRLPLIGTGRAVTPREEGDQNVRLIKPSDFNLMFVPEEQALSPNCLALPYQYAVELDRRNREKAQKLSQLQETLKTLSMQEADLFTKRVDARFQDWAQRSFPNIFNMCQDT